MSLVEELLILAELDLSAFPKPVADWRKSQACHPAKDPLYWAWEFTRRDAAYQILSELLPILEKYCWANRELRLSEILDGSEAQPVDVTAGSHVGNFTEPLAHIYEYLKHKYPEAWTRLSASIITRSPIERIYALVQAELRKFEPFDDRKNDGTRLDWTCSELSAISDYRSDGREVSKPPFSISWPGSEEITFSSFELTDSIYVEGHGKLKYDYQGEHEKVMKQIAVGSRQDIESREYASESDLSYLTTLAFDLSLPILEQIKTAKDILISMQSRANKHDGMRKQRKPDSPDSRTGEPMLRWLDWMAEGKPGTISDFLRTIDRDPEDRSSYKAICDKALYFRDSNDLRGRVISTARM